jgi:hypothetical protein
VEEHGTLKAVVREEATLVLVEREPDWRTKPYCLEEQKERQFWFSWLVAVLEVVLSWMQ